jgi:hypothetical protein
MSCGSVLGAEIARRQIQPCNVIARRPRSFIIRKTSTPNRCSRRSRNPFRSRRRAKYESANDCMVVVIGTPRDAFYVGDVSVGVPLR